MQVIDALADEPEHEVDVPSRPDQAVRADQHTFVCGDLAHQRRDVLAVGSALRRRPQTPLGTEPVEGEADVLPRGAYRPRRLPDGKWRGCLAHLLNRNQGTAVVRRAPTLAPRARVPACAATAARDGCVPAPGAASH